MKKCRHRDVQILSRGGSSCTFPCCEERQICRDCWEHLPLGPSNDTPDVLVEIRAAEIAADHGNDAFKFISGTEWFGWAQHVVSDQENTTVNDFEWAGWLAREIVETP